MNLVAVLASNFITEEAFEAGIKEEYDKFLHLRGEALINRIESLCAGQL